MGLKPRGTATSEPRFWILDGSAVDGRDGLYGIATTTQVHWWKGDFGRVYTGRGGEWLRRDVSWNVPVSLCYRHESADSPRGWTVLCASGRLIGVTADGSWEHDLELRGGALRRIRTIGTELCAVGAHGQILRGRGASWRAFDEGVFAAGSSRFLTDVAGTGDDDIAVVGRGGEVFLWDGTRWNEQPVPSGEDLFAVLRPDRETLLVCGDRGAIFSLEKKGWRSIPSDTERPMVGLARFESRLWAASCDRLLVGSERGVTSIDDGPGFGGLLGVGDGRLYCFGAAEVAVLADGTWTSLTHPDQARMTGAPAWPALGPSLEEASRPVIDATRALGGRLFTADDTADDDLRRWASLSSRPDVVRSMLGGSHGYRVLEVHGDLHVDGNLDTFEHKLIGLVVHGNLTIDGVFSDADDPATLTLVGGTLNARSVITSGDFEVRGDLRCEALMGDYNDYGATIHGKVNARLFWPENHHFELAKMPEIELVVGYGCEHRVPSAVRRAVRETPLREVAARLAAELFVIDPAELDTDEEPELDRKSTLTALRSGRAIWRQG